MKRWLRGSYFRTLLAWFITIGVLPALIAGVTSIVIIERTLADNAVRQTAESLTRIGEDMERAIDEYAHILDTLAHDPDICAVLLADRASEFYAAKYTLHLTMAGKSGLAAAHVVDIDTDTAISTADVPRSYRYPYNRNWRIFRKVEESGAFAIQMGDKSLTALPEVVMTLCKRVSDADGKPLGYVLIDVFAAALKTVIRDDTLFYNAEMYLSDNHEYMIYNTDGALYPTLARIPETLRQIRAANAHEYTLGTRTLLVHEGRDIALLEMPVARDEAVLYVTVPLYAIAQDTSAIRAMVMAVVIACLVLSILVALLVAGSVANPIKALSRAMRQIERGDYGARVDFKRYDELGALGRSFNEMADTIRTLLDNIEEKQRRLNVSESKALQAQINPHFLYNALDAIKWSARMGETEKVPELAVRLGRLLRSIANTKEDVIPVSDELKLVEDYLSIQQIRYGDRLAYAIRVPDAIRACRVPKLILEPIAENAVVHGVENIATAGRIEIDAHMDGAYAVFSIRDNGPGIAPDALKRLNHPDAAQGWNIGLANVDARAKLYGDESCGIHIESAPGAGTTVYLRVKPLGGGNTI